MDSGMERHNPPCDWSMTTGRGWGWGATEREGGGHV